MAKEKRKPPIGKSLLKNSKAAMYAAIEIHNKPLFPYRYEIVVLLTLNAWELLLKAYIYMRLKKVKLFYKDGTSKQFSECLGCVKSDIGKDFFPAAENLEVLYFYRNKIAHFFTQELDLLVYALLRKNVSFYSHFLKDKFNQDISEESDLVLLPIGFRKFYSPLDFLSNNSNLSDGSKDLRSFIKVLVDSTERLCSAGIDEPIITDFKLNLINENRIKNADIIAGVNNQAGQSINFLVEKKEKRFRVSPASEATPIAITRDKTSSVGLLLHEEISEGIFDEINNVIETNRILSKGTNTFQLGQSLYYRIYSERHHVDLNINNFQLLATTGLQMFYAPFLFWLAQLPAEIVCIVLRSLWNQSKAPYINNLARIAILLGPDFTEWLSENLDAKFKKSTQPPEFYYTWKKMLASKTKDPILRVLNVSPARKLELPDKSLPYTHLLENPSIAANYLSELSLSIFKGNVRDRSIARELDYLSYGHLFVARAEELNESFFKPKTAQNKV